MSSGEVGEEVRNLRGGERRGVGVFGEEGEFGARGGEGRKGAGERTVMPLKQEKTGKGVEDSVEGRKVG